MYDAQVRLDDTPLEGGLLFTCKLKTDTDFLGRYTHCLKITIALEIIITVILHRAALEAQRKEGARKKKVCFTVDDQVTFNLLVVKTKRLK